MYEREQTKEQIGKEIVLEKCLIPWGEGTIGTVYSSNGANPAIMGDTSQHQPISHCCPQMRVLALLTEHSSPSC